MHLTLVTSHGLTIGITFQKWIFSDRIVNQNVIPNPMFTSADPVIISLIKRINFQTFARAILINSVGESVAARSIEPRFLKNRGSSILAQTFPIACNGEGGSETDGWGNYSSFFTFPQGISEAPSLGCLPLASRLH